jgi:putative ABC transport system substrate-binding protein
MLAASPSRVLIGALILLGSARWVAAGPRVEPPTVVVITSSNIGAFDEAVEGVRSSLGSAVKLVTVDLAASDKAVSDPASLVGGKDVRLVVTIGNNALEAALRFGAPVIATMILRQDLASFQARAPGQVRPPAGAVVLDVTLADVLSGLARLFPGKTRVGIVRRMDAGDPSDAALVAQARAAGVMLTVVDCPRPDRLLPSFLTLKTHVDFVWCPPDGTLYNGTTVKPLILASLENQLPVAGFSASFVRAGAAAGIYPDYRELGVQTGEMARRFLDASDGSTPPTTSPTTSIESPRKTRVALNQRVARLLGLRGAEKNAMASGIVEIE